MGEQTPEEAARKRRQQLAAMVDRTARHIAQFVREEMGIAAEGDTIPGGNERLLWALRGGFEDRLLHDLLNETTGVAQQLQSLARKWRSVKRVERKVRKEHPRHTALDGFYNDLVAAGKFDPLQQSLNEVFPLIQQRARKQFGSDRGFSDPTLYRRLRERYTRARIMATVTIRDVTTRCKVDRH